MAEEEPLEIRLNGTPVAVTMRTPGHDNELAAGFLWSEGLIRHTADCTGVRTRNNVADVQTVANSEPSTFSPRMVTSACGICGRSSLDQVHQSTRFVPVK
ncbi:MAG: formate dehydrogenase accessory sulfurtransferase FdhD, partial [Armatimonadaceae bacterium]